MERLPELPERVIKDFRRRGLPVIPVPVEVLLPGKREGLYVRAYHITPRESLSFIRIVGLVPKPPLMDLPWRVRGYRLPGIYLLDTAQYSQFIFQPREYPRSVRAGKDAMVILEVKVPVGTPALRDPELMEIKEVIAFVIFTPIPPILVSPVQVMAMEVTRRQYMYQRTDPVSGSLMFTPSGKKVMAEGISTERRLLRGPWREEMAYGWSDSMTSMLPEDVTYFGLNW